MAYRPSIRLLITALVVGPLVVAVSLLVWLSARSTERIAEDLGAQLTNAASTSVEREVDRYLAEAVQVSELYARRLERGILSADDLASWRPTLLDDLVTNTDVASICFANERGQATWLLRANDRLEYGIASGPEMDAAVEKIVDPQSGEFTGEARPPYQYLAQQRPWYLSAIADKQPHWTKIYFWFGDGGSAAATGTGFTRAIHKPDGTLVGVLVIDVTLSGLSDFLKRLPLADRGGVYLVDGDGYLVAASRGEVNSIAGSRLNLAGVNDPAAQAAYWKVNDTLEHTHEPPGKVVEPIQANGEMVRMSVTPMTPYPGIDWRMVLLVPEKEFLGKAESLRDRSLAIAGIVAFAAIATGLWFSKQLTTPLLSVVQHVRRIAKGDFASRIELQSAKELGELSTELNQMASGLKERMELERALGLATDVQQCLLPETTPRVRGFDVASRSRYCDTTGGDYFDFIDVARLPEGGLLIAVGDVTGHGIASALIMASARAAVRAYAADEPNLGTLMTKVNRVFSADSRHGRFMTLALLAADRPTGPFRWASAGHDATIGYDPAADAFFELEGGDFPLGVVDDNTFEEYRRDSLPAGTILLLGTDGIWETASPTGEAYGKDRLRAAMRAARHGSADEVASAVEADLTAFRGEGSVLDDITMVVIKLAS